MNRCSWVDLNSEIYIKYHDEEWGVSSFDDRYLFEMLILEMFQAGLSFLTVLEKRNDFRLAFDNFDVKKVSNYDDKKIKELLTNKNIIRNKLKITSTINNANVFIKIQKEYGSFSNYIWSFTNNKVIKNHNGIKVANSPLSDKITYDLKKRGMKFIGSTIIYSYLQAIGIIDDHEKNCFKA